MGIEWTRLRNRRRISTKSPKLTANSRSYRGLFAVDTAVSLTRSRSMRARGRLQARRYSHAAVIYRHGIALSARGEAALPRHLRSGNAVPTDVVSIKAGLARLLAHCVKMTAG